MALYHAYANKRNLGDWLSAKAIDSELKCSGVKSLLWTKGEFENTLSRIRQLNEDDLIIVGGGGMLKDFFEDLWKGMVDCRARLALWGIGICHNKAEETALDPSLVARIVERSEIIAVRDVLTERVFSEFGVTPTLSGCPAIDYVRRRWARKEEPILLHAVHPESLGDRLHDWRTAARAFARVHKLDYVEHDHALPRGRLKRWRAMRDTRQFYGSAQVIVSSRLHGVLFGLALEKPLIVISGDEKIEGFWCHTVGAKQCASYDDDPDGFFKMIELPESNGVKVAANVTELIEKNTDVAKRVSLLARSFM